MANGDYWNKGRREGFQGNTGLDTLERILGIGSNIAGKVQANRDKRSEVYQMRMLHALDAGQNKDPLHKRTFDNTVIDELKDTFIKTMGDGIDSTNLKTKELYDLTLKEFEDAKKLNNEYNEIDRPFFAKTESELVELVNGFVKIQNTATGAEKRAQMDLIETKINDYSKRKMEMVVVAATKVVVVNLI